MIKVKVYDLIAEFYAQLMLEKIVLFMGFQKMNTKPKRKQQTLIVFFFQTSHEELLTKVTTKKTLFSTMSCNKLIIFYRQQSRQHLQHYEFNCLLFLIVYCY